MSPGYGRNLRYQEDAIDTKRINSDLDSNDEEEPDPDEFKDVEPRLNTSHLNRSSAEPRTSQIA